LPEQDVDVKTDDTTGYKPTTWLSYKGKIDDGFLDSMKTVFRYRNLTEVQNTIISKMPIERDLLVRSKTGTGKTIAFLVPAVQRYLDYLRDNKLNPRTYPKTHCGILIVSPTRELAMQIAAEARRLIFNIEPNGMKVQVLVGGDPKRNQIRRMDRERNDIIVATPGRLLDFLHTEPGIKDMLLSIRTLVLDETDSLLEMGFRSEMEELSRELKETEANRLTMMFSATVSPEVKALANRYVGNGVEFINTVKDTDVDVHMLINQTYIVHDMSDHLKIILSLIITEQMQKPNGKVIVFMNTTKQVQLYTLMFRYLRKLYFNLHFQQFEIHSKKDQAVRSKVSQAFRTANVGSVLFTSDVS
jgi:ATP-dependent RNA helicase MSS116, mitochondrial